MTTTSSRPGGALHASGGMVVPQGLGWLAEYVGGLRSELLNEPFYEAVDRMSDIREFGWARHLLQHSTEFPKVLQLRVTLNTDPGLSAFLAQHVAEEVGHSDMLIRWLVEHGLVASAAEALPEYPTYATVACLGQAFRAAASPVAADHIVALNVATEAASFDFFNVLSPKLDGLGLGAHYWRLHMEADEFHSADGLALLDECTETSDAGQNLMRWAREAAVFWGAMLNSWVGVDRWPTLRV